MRKLVSIIGVLCFFSFAGSVDAAAFAKYDGVDGEAVDKDHAGWTNVTSVSWGARKPGGGATGQSRRRGGVIVEDLVVTSEYEKSSPQLEFAALTGRVIPRTVVEFTQPCGSTGAERATYLKYELVNVQVTSFQVNVPGDSDSVPATESFSLNFEEIKVTYTENDSEVCGKGTETSYSYRVEDK